MGGGDAELFHDDVARGAEAEAVDGHGFAIEADIAEPRVGDAGFDRDAFAAGFWQDGFFVFRALGFEVLEAGHGHDAGAGAEFGGGIHGVLEFAAAGEEDEFQCGGFFFGNVAALQNTLAAGGDGDAVLRWQILAREHEHRRAVGLLEGGGKGSSGLLGVGRTDNIQAGNRAQGSYGLDGFVGRAVFSNAHGVVGENVNGREMRQCGKADGWAAVIAEDEEGRTAGTEDAVVGDAVHDAAHGVFADAEVEVASGVVGAVKVTAVLDVVQRGAVQVGAAAGDERHGSADRLQHIAAGLAGGDIDGWIERRDDIEEVRSFPREGVIDFLGQIGVGGAPGGVGCFPRGVFGLEDGFAFFEIGLCLGTDEKGLLGQAERLAGFGDEFHAGLAVGFVCAADLGNAFSDERLGDDELRLAAGGGFGLRECLSDLVEVVSIDLVDIPPDGSVARGGVLALCDGAHGIERHIVRIINEDQVVEAEVAGERAGFHRHAFLKAAITCERDDMVVENAVRGCVEAGLAHFGRDSKTNGIRYALAERARGGLDAGGFVKLRMAGSDAAELAEIFDFFQGHAVSREVEPAVEEHAAVACGEDEAVAVQPAGRIGIEAHQGSEENGSDVRRAKREAEVAGFAFRNGVHGQSTGVAGGEFKRRGV